MGCLTDGVTRVVPPERPGELSATSWNDAPDPRSGLNADSPPKREQALSLCARANTHEVLPSTQFSWPSGHLCSAFARISASTGHTRPLALGRRPLGPAGPAEGRRDRALGRM